jgi:hypothetical protein
VVVISPFPTPTVTPTAIPHTLPVSKALTDTLLLQCQPGRDMVIVTPREFYAIVHCVVDMTPPATVVPPGGQ